MRVSVLLCAALAVGRAETLIWNEEFDTLDMNSWTHELLPKGKYNNELQRYVDSPENSFVKDGALHIVAKREADGSFTSARLITQNKKDFAPPLRVEVRAKVPIGEGLWPAIWMLPTANIYGAWPDSGEIDIMEHVSCTLGEIHGTVHTKAYNHMLNTQKGKHIVTGRAGDLFSIHEDFHVYQLIWRDDGVYVGMDNQYFFAYPKEANAGPSTWPFSESFHLLLNVAVGGNWGGFCLGNRDPVFTGPESEQTMIVDSVKVFAGNDITAPEICAPIGNDPYFLGSPARCCGSAVMCLKNWNQDGTTYNYRCVADANACDGGKVSTSAPTTGVPVVSPSAPPSPAPAREPGTAAPTKLLRVDRPDSSGNAAVAFASGALVIGVMSTALIIYLKWTKPDDRPGIAPDTTLSGSRSGSSSGSPRQGAASKYST